MSLLWCVPARGADRENPSFENELIMPNIHVGGLVVFGAMHGMYGL